MYLINVALFVDQKSGWLKCNVNVAGKRYGDGFARVTVTGGDLSTWCRDSCNTNHPHPYWQRCHFCLYSLFLSYCSKFSTDLCIKLVTTVCIKTSLKYINIINSKKQLYFWNVFNSYSITSSCQPSSRSLSETCFRRPISDPCS